MMMSQLNFFNLLGTRKKTTTRKTRNITFAKRGRSQASPNYETSSSRNSAVRQSIDFAQNAKIFRKTTTAPQRMIKVRNSDVDLRTSQVPLFVQNLFSYLLHILLTSETYSFLFYYYLMTNSIQHDNNGTDESPMASIVSGLQRPYCWSLFPQ